jgi:hypothetical protein
MMDHKNPDPFPCASLLPCPENLIGAARFPAGGCSSASSFTRNKISGGIGMIEGLLFREQAPCSV